ncbi:MAG: universal stress protein [Rhodococcus sp. (in: high G+C Gram-positive bacteria)]|uniref:universal stress protein n=1 Tax=Rhodococcus sp. TaxID=1831 RepID=UPI003BAF322C
MTTAPIRHGIVVGIDGSDGAVEAARWAASAADRFDEPLRLTHVLPVPQHPGGESNTEGEELLDAAERAVRADRPNLPVERRILSGPPARVFVELSQTARIVVLGPASTSEMRSIFVGSDVVRISNNAHCPVAVWRGVQGHEVTDSLPVTVGVDGSPLSEMAVTHAFELASFFGCPLVAVHSWSEQSTLGGYSEVRRFTDWSAHQQHLSAVVAESLAGWCEKYPDVQVTRCIERGGPMRVLLEHSVRSQLVVVGSHGRTPFMASVVGSTAQSLIHHARCPVLVCRDG